MTTDRRLGLPTSGVTGRRARFPGVWWASLCRLNKRELYDKIVHLGRVPPVWL